MDGMDHGPTPPHRRQDVPWVWMARQRSIPCRRTSTSDPEKINVCKVREPAAWIAERGKDWRHRTTAMGRGPDRLDGDRLVYLENTVESIGLSFSLRHRFFFVSFLFRLLLLVRGDLRAIYKYAPHRHSLFAPNWPRFIQLGFVCFCFFLLDSDFDSSSPVDTSFSLLAPPRSLAILHTLPVCPPSLPTAPTDSD